MRNLAASALLLVVLLCGGSAAPAGGGEVRPGRQLILHLITLAESGSATDAASVARALAVKFTPRVRSADPPSETCAPGYRATPSIITDYDPSATLAPTRFGRSSIVRPGFGVINATPALISGATKITYHVLESHDCSGYVQSHNDVEANLEISPLPSFDCMTFSDLVRWFPQIRPGSATDGAQVYYYETDGTNRRGTTLSFQSFYGSPCLLGISLTQRSSDSARHRKAKERQYACMLPHEQAFCRSHVPFDWGAGDVQDEMASFAMRKCGTLDAFIASTPENARPDPTGGPTEDYPDPSQSTPCGMVEDALKRRHSR